MTPRPDDDPGPFDLPAAHPPPEALLDLAIGLDPAGPGSGDPGLEGQGVGGPAAVGRHVAACPSCGAALAALRREQAALAGAFAAPAPAGSAGADDALAARIVAAVAAARAATPAAVIDAAGRGGTIGPRPAARVGATPPRGAPAARARPVWRRAVVVACAAAAVVLVVLRPRAPTPREALLDRVRWSERRALGLEEGA